MKVSMSYFFRLFGRTLAVSAGLYISSVVYGGDRQIPFYNDTFDSTGLLVENFDLKPANAWGIKGGRMVAKGTASAVLRKKCEDDCIVGIDITPLKVRKDFSGIVFRGIKFLIRPDGFWYVYRLKGAARSSGMLFSMNIKSGVTYKMKIISKKIKNAWLFVWYINGEKITEFIESGKLEDKTFFALFRYTMPVAFDNLAISRIVSGSLSPNLLRNGSFEYLWEDMMPLGCKPVDMSTVIATYGTLENFWKTWKVDASDKWEGKYSMYLENNALTHSNGIYSSNVGINPGTPVTYSVYLRGNKADLKAQLVIWEWLGRWHIKKIKLTTDWKRYVFTRTRPGPQI